MIGQILGRCRITSKIGEGGMGVVYRAYDEVLHRDVAVKVVKKSDGRDAAATQDLLHEARASSSLSHPNICMIHDVGETSGELYIVMELVEGKSLYQLSASAGLPPESVLHYGVQIASALARAHDRGIVHRDLKTANIVVTPEGLVKVLDFGLAKRVGGGVLDGPTMSFTSVQEASKVSGTLPYMAPEILRGMPADGRSDLWALGVILYELSSGQLPFQGVTGFEISSAIMREMPKPLGPPVPPGLWAIIQRCLAKEPMQRYQRASEVHAALEAVESARMVVPEPALDPNAAPRTTMMHSVHHTHVRKGDFLLLVGTTKGAFLLRSNAQRTRWEVGGPYFHGNCVYSLAYDNRAGRHRIWASTTSYWGTVLRNSDDFGKSWTNPPQAPIRFPQDTGLALKNIWQITLAPHDPNLLYCGVEPAALFESRDAGESWTLVRGLFDHPHRPRWLPGNGGLALHTILLDPANRLRMYIAISSGGVYRTDDGGSTWAAANRGVRAVFKPDKYPEFGQCVHKIVLHPMKPERLFLQNHWGLYRSDNCGDSWMDIANGVPSDFGFALAMHPRKPDWVYAFPVDSDEFRCSCEGRLRVYRTRNAGASWEPLSRGLPQKSTYETVLRDAMITDSYDPAGIYFGTRSGQLFASRDEGKSWQRIAEGLPSILCLRSAIIEDSSSSARPVSPKSQHEATMASKSSRKTKSGSSRKR